MNPTLARIVQERDVKGLERLVSLYTQKTETDKNPPVSPRRVSFAEMVNAQDDKGMTIIHHILHGHVDSVTSQIIKMLLDNGARVDLGDRLGLTALHVAVIQGYEDIVCKILDVCPHAIDVKNKEGLAALHNASLCCSDTIIKLLIARGANKDIRDIHGASPLHFAARYGNIVAVQALLECGALISRDLSGCTPLHYAAHNGRKVIVRILANHYQEYVNIRNNAGETPLHLAVKSIRYPDVKILLNAGADVLARDNEGRTSFHYAAKSRNKKLLKLFKGRIAECINCRDNAGLTPYEFACIGVQPTGCAELRAVLTSLSLVS
jgi:ankyrin repeat protein